MEATPRSHPVLAYRRHIAVIAALMCVILVWATYPTDAWFARHDLRAELMTIPSTPQAGLDALARFVKIGDHIHEVEQRLFDPGWQKPSIEKNTYIFFPLGGVNLELAYTKQGRVVAIGRHIYDQDEGVVWYKSVWWPEHVAPAR